MTPCQTKDCPEEGDQIPILIFHGPKRARKKEPELLGRLGVVFCPSCRENITLERILPEEAFNVLRKIGKKKGYRTSDEEDFSLLWLRHLK